MAEVEHLKAAISLSSESGEIPTEFVYLPEGTHEIQASVNGKAATRAVTIGPDSLGPLVEALSARQTRNVRPFGGFDHKDGGPASFIPKGFSYRPGKGVMLEVEWTAAGRSAVEGKDYSYFSPSFYRNKATGAPLGLPMHGEIGSLVNEPAFESIERIAASHQDVTEMETEQILAALANLNLLKKEEVETVKASLEKLSETIQANSAAITETAVSLAVAEATKGAPEKSELEVEVQRLKDENKTLSESLSAKRAADADEAISEAVKAGRIPAQDEDTKGYWRDQLTNEVTAAKAKKELAKLPDAEALKAGRKIDASKGDDKELTGLARVTAAFSKSN